MGSLIIGLILKISAIRLTETADLGTTIKIIEIIKRIEPTANTDANDLISEGVLDSISVLRLVGELEDKFDIEVTAGQVIKDNFKNIDAIQDFVNRALEEQ